MPSLNNLRARLSVYLVVLRLGSFHIFTEHLTSGDRNGSDAIASFRFVNVFIGKGSSEYAKLSEGILRRRKLENTSLYVCVCVCVYSISIANPEPEVRSSGRVYNVALHLSARPDLWLGIPH